MDITIAVLIADTDFQREAYLVLMMIFAAVGLLYIVAAFIIGIPSRLPPPPLLPPFPIPPVPPDDPASCRDCASERAFHRCDHVTCLQHMTASHPAVRGVQCHCREESRNA